MATMTLSFPRSGLRSSMEPWKFTNGPSMTRTLSPFWNVDLSFGFSAPSSLLRRVPSTPLAGRGTGVSPPPPPPAEDPLDPVGGQRDRLGPRAHEPRHLRRRAHEVPGVVGQLHLHEEVAREELLLDLDLLALPDLPHLLRRHHHPADHLGQAEDLGARLDRLRHLVLEPRVGVDDEPLLGLGRGLGLAHFRIFSTMRESPMSTAPRKKASTNTTNTTTTGGVATSARLGHVTRRNSAATSRKT